MKKWMIVALVCSLGLQTISPKDLVAAQQIGQTTTQQTIIDSENIVGNTEEDIEKNIEETTKDQSSLSEEQKQPSKTDQDGQDEIKITETDSSMEFYQEVSEMTKNAEDVIEETTEGEYENARLIVKSYASLDFSDYEGFCQVVYDGNEYYILQFTSDETAKQAEEILEALEEVEYVEPDAPIYLNPDEGENSWIYEEEDSLSISEANEHKSWGISHIGVDEYSETIPKEKRKQLIVAVLDTGVDASHSYLEGRVLQGYDFVDDDSDADDGHHHGTHVSGTIVDATLTMTNIKILPVRVFDSNGKSSVVRTCSGIRYAAENGAKIINMSIGGSHADFTYASIHDAIAYATEKGSLCVVAAGNQASTGGADTANMCPAHIASCLTVSAVDSGDPENRAYFSNYGNAVDVCAPGVGINSCIPGESWNTINGTSMATPHVSAAAALVALQHPDATVTELHDLVKSYTRDLGATGWDRYFGNGIIDLRVGVEKEAQESSATTVSTTEKEPESTTGTATTQAREENSTAESTTEKEPESTTSTATTQAREENSTAESTTEKEPESTTSTATTQAREENSTAESTTEKEPESTTSTATTQAREDTPASTESRKKSIAKAKVTLSQKSFSYDGKKKNPSVGVTLDNEVLKENRDYTVTYYNNIKVGTATVLITGMNQYEDSIEVSFTITKATNYISAKNIEKTYSGKKITFSVGATNTKKQKLYYNKLSLTTNRAVSLNASGQVTIPSDFVGTFKIRIYTKESDCYNATSRTIKVTIKKATQPMTLSPVSKSYQYTALKKSAKSFCITIKNEKGKVTYTSSNKKYVTVTSKGKVTIKKKAPKGTYTITVKAVGNSYYNSGTKTVTIKVK